MLIELRPWFILNMAAQTVTKDRSMVNSAKEYYKQITELYNKQYSTEHTYRNALILFLNSILEHALIINEPSSTSCGRPDLAIRRRIGQSDVIIGYIETKAPSIQLNNIQGKEQIKKYLDYLPNFVLTNYIEFWWYVNGSLRKKASFEYSVESVVELLQEFYSHQIYKIDNAVELANIMAKYAHLIRGSILDYFNNNKSADNDILYSLRDVIAKTLLPDVANDDNIQDFSDMVAQTLVYGLFAARCHTKRGQSFSLEVAEKRIPKTSPLLIQFFDSLANAALENESFVKYLSDLADILREVDIDSILESFVRNFGRYNSIVHFYETFLERYDPDIREIRGVYYTPKQVVDYMVRCVSQILELEFGIKHGIANTEAKNPPLYVLDPATGTGSFLVGIVEYVESYLKNNGLGGLWNGETKSILAQRLLGFEVLMAPYVMAHLNLGLALEGAKNVDRLGIYLTNTLSNSEPELELFGPWSVMSKEARAASDIKNKRPILVIIGNPPYNQKSANKSSWIYSLIKESYYPKDNIKEINLSRLSNDYVKFIRWAQWKIEQNGEGLLAFITHNGYLDNITFRGMREELLKFFDKIYILNLRGEAAKNQEKFRDENVFNIKQGVAIIFAIKKKSRNETKYAELYYSEILGDGEYKYSYLIKNDFLSTEFKPIYTREPYFLFNNRVNSEYDDYHSFISVESFFKFSSPGIITGNDSFFCRI